ncbi:MAG: flagellar brake protein [Sulfuritalea sp.]|nr:flagellar brake protein [Sulfuritalea sp.]
MSGTEAHLPAHQEASTPVVPPTAAQNLAAELLSTDEFSQYMLNSKSEMFAIFRGMVEHVSQITMFFKEGRDMVLTDMISYGDNGLLLDLGASPEMNSKALEARKLFCVTQLDKVKIQFILRGLERIETKGRAGVPRRPARQRAAPAASRVLPAGHTHRAPAEVRHGLPP